MKRILIFIIATALCFVGIACKRTTPVKEEEKKVNVVTTIFPVYDWVKNVAGNNADITMLLDSGVDLHSYQPSTDDLIKISNCDLFIYVGGESDEWVETALKAVPETMLTINLMDILKDDLKEEDEFDEPDKQDTDEVEYDEHIWMSVRNASKCIDVISKALKQLDSKNADTYEKNTSAYKASLNDIDQEFKKVVENADVKTVVVGDRFPYKYLMNDYGIEYFAAFSGCSAESEASFETVISLAKQIDKNKLKTVICTESNNSIAEVIVSNTKTKDQQILCIHSMQGVTIKDIENGASYLAYMRSNINALRDALKTEE